MLVSQTFQLSLARIVITYAIIQHDIFSRDILTFALRRDSRSASELLLIDIYSYII